MKLQSRTPVTRFVTAEEGEMHRIIGARMRHRRILLGKTQVEVAAACGVTYTTIQKYENGSQISASRLWAVSNTLDVAMDYFFHGLSRPNGPSHALGNSAGA